MLRISPDEYRTRLEALQAGVQEAGLDLFIVSALDKPLLPDWGRLRALNPGSHLS